MAVIENIYIDEAGNTGQDLLNSDQPVFVLATNNFKTKECEELASIFKNSSELHFKKLKESSDGRSSIIKFLNHPLISENNIICSVAHKEYCTVGQIVDQIIEPVLYKNGVDLYQFGQNISVTNFIYSFGNFFWDKTAFAGLLQSFIEMIRTKTPESINSFYNFAKQVYDSANEKALLEPILESREQISSILEEINKFTIDLTLSSFYILCDKWFKNTGSKLNILQDDSKQMAFYREYIDFTMSLKIDQQDIGYDSRKMIFPTQIESLHLVNSNNYLGVQISDLIASSIAFMFSNRNQKHSGLVDQIKNSRLLNLTNYHTIWPNTNITPEDLGMDSGKGQNLLDFIADQRVLNN